MLYLFTLLLALSWAWVPPLGAKPPHCLTGSYEKLMIDRISQLVPEITEQPSVGQGSYLFYQRQITLTLQPTQQVWLASTLNGNGMLATDDQVQITILPSGHIFQQVFQNQSSTAITHVAPVELTHLLTLGTNTITFTAQDLMGPVFGTTPYYLLILRPCTRQPPPAPVVLTESLVYTGSAVPAVSQVWLPLVMRPDITPLTVTSAPMETPQPLTVDTAMPMTLAMAAVPPTLAPAPSASSGPRHWLLIWLVLVSIAAVPFVMMSQHPILWVRKVLSG